MADMLQQVTVEHETLEAKIKNLELTINGAVVELEECRGKLFELSMRKLYITEIYRLAKIHLPRLRREKIHELHPLDFLELDKWIRRAHSTDGLKSIIEAFLELEKYQPIDIRGNLYALIQKIIIGGPFHGKKK